MDIQATEIPGAFLIELAPHTDERGMFARTWDALVAKKHGLVERFDYSCISTNIQQYTLRGMHYQKAPYGEVKLVRCTKGEVFDVVLDLRPNSKAFKKWIFVKLSDSNHRALYIPEGCAHGFLSLTDNSEVLYNIRGEYNEKSASGVRFNDPAFSMIWPKQPVVISERDKTYPDFI